MLKDKYGCDTSCTSWIISSILLVVSYTSIEVIGESNIFPTIIWDPRNPLFGCNRNNYVLRVPLKTKLFFACPSTDNRFFNDDGRYNYENMYFLGEDKAAFDSCNATNAKRRVLYCGANPKYKSQYVLVTDMTASSELSPFYEGKTYYYIGTGFRSLSRLDDKVGGSCNTTDSVGQYKLRLTLYVCKQREVANGECNVCRTKGCYLKDCGTCVTLQEEKYYYNETSGSCFKLDKTTCTNQLLGTRTVETDIMNVTCPTQSTTTVKAECITRQDKDYYYNKNNNSCYKLNKTTCVNTKLGTSATKTTLINVTCPTEAIVKEAVQPQTPTGLNMQILWVVMVGLCSLCVGIFGGGMGYRWYHERKCSKCKGNNKVSSQDRRVGFVNKGFDRHLSGENGGILSGPVHIDEKGLETKDAEAF